MTAEPALPSSTPSSGAVTIRGLGPELKARLRIRAAHNARSMEAEARAILEAALAAPDEDPTDLAAFARGLFTPLGGVELELPSREPTRDPPNFGEAARSAAPPDQTSHATTPSDVRRAGTSKQGATSTKARRRR